MGPRLKLLVQLVQQVYAKGCADKWTEDTWRSLSDYAVKAADNKNGDVRKEAASLLNAMTDAGSLAHDVAKRAIEPRLGTWGIPQGFMELGETTREAAAREAQEETGAVLDPSEMVLLALYNIGGSQVQVVYEAPLPADAKLETSTIESSEIKLFEEADALAADLCFPTVGWALERCFSSLGRARRVQERTKAFQDGEWRVVVDDDGGGYLTS